jgi:DNA repair protein RecO (recombination protein O)
MKRVQTQPAYILYTKPFRDTSLLLEVFSRHYGRISLIARGAKPVTGLQNRANRGRRARFQSVLQAFIPLLLSWKGHTELLSLTAAEPYGLFPMLSGQVLICGLYLNELITKTLHRFDAHPVLFDAYQQCLQALSESPQVSLRRFEKQLLTELGFAPRLNYEVSTGQMVKADQWYLFKPGWGMYLQNSHLYGVQNREFFRGDVLLSLHEDRFEPSHLQETRRLLYLMLDYLLGGVVIRSRELLSSI